MNQRVITLHPEFSRSRPARRQQQPHPVERYDRLACLIFVSPVRLYVLIFTPIHGGQGRRNALTIASTLSVASRVCRGGRIDRRLP
jgi:hypothetical protein